MRFGEVLNQIVTIARHGIVQAVRMKIVLVVAVFLVVLVPALPFLLKSDNTLDGQLRMIITYSLYLTSFLLSVITLFLSVAALNFEIKGRQILVLDPKPVHRFTLLVGKWLGIMLINLALLIAMMGVTYGLVRWFGRPPRPVKLENLGKHLREAGVDTEAVERFNATQRQLFAGAMDPEESAAFNEAVAEVAKKLSEDRQNRAVFTLFRNAVERTQNVAEDYQNTKATVMTARVARGPVLPDVGGWVEERIAQMKQNDMMPELRSEQWVRQRLSQQFSRSAWQVPPGGIMHWEIHDLPQFKGWLVIRFRFLRDRGEPDNEILVRFVITGRDDRQSVVRRHYRVDMQHAFSVPSTLVRQDGTIDISFENLDSGEEPVAAWFPAQGGISVLFPAGSMAENFLRAGLVILAKLSFIAILGVFASTFLSLPVGVFMTTVVFFAGHMRDYFLTEILSDFYLFGSSVVPPGTPLNPADEVLRYILYYVFAVFPNFGAYDIVTPLAEGHLIAAGMLAHCFWWFVLIRGSILVLAAWFIFRRRELAALTPQS